MLTVVLVEESVLMWPHGVIAASRHPDTQLGRLAWWPRCLQKLKHERLDFDFIALDVKPTVGTLLDPGLQGLSLQVRTSEPANDPDRTN